MLRLAETVFGSQQGTFVLVSLEVFYKAKHAPKPQGVTKAARVASIAAWEGNDPHARTFLDGSTYCTCANVKPAEHGGLNRKI